MKKYWIVVIILWGLFSCNKNDDIRVSNQLTDETYELYNSILLPLSSINIVQSSTDTSLNCNDIAYYNPDTMGINQTIINECKTLNNKTYILEKEKILSGGITLVTVEEIKNAESDVKIFEKYGAYGLFIFGMPVFFENNTRAMIEYNHVCGPLCGNGAIYTFKKENEIWKVEHILITWISK